jgi:hypothetical protein
MVTRITACLSRKSYHNPYGERPCSLRPDRVFCDLPADALEAFDSIKTIALYPGGATLFNEGRPARGVFCCATAAPSSPCPPAMAGG